ncbi:beta strand repeat-containing protein [Thioalkalivibrio sp. HK1]|uniref:beta strand repeat-containing protein n=1 Tax=Thioalkalivibrio sp. HK1 TaxID=1469245 RepID=UPI0004B2258E|nr:hypothetical protein [Thioalkalivibrio sp. HK1]
MNTTTIDCTGSNQYPAPVPLDGSPTERPLRSAIVFTLTLILGSLSMLAAFPGTAGAQITAAKDCIARPVGNSGSYTSTCAHDVSLTGYKTLNIPGATQCNARTGTSATIDAGSSGTIGVAENPQTVCLEYTDAATQYSSGYAACNITANDCGSSGVTYSEATKLPVATISVGSTSLDEGGSSGATIAIIVSDSQAIITQNLVINFTSDNSDVTITPTSLTFTESNKNTAQTITLTGAQDADGVNDTATITATPAITSGVYAAVATGTATVFDDDDGIVLSDAAVTVNEGGGPGTFTVELSKEPSSGPVTLSVASGDTNLVTVSPRTLTFTTSNYSTAQTVIVTPAGSDNDGTDESVNITVSATSGTTAIDQTKTITVADDDGEIVVSAGVINLIEGGSAGSLAVTLGAPPKASATITVTSDDTGAVTVSPASLTFSASNYQTPQTVTLTPVIDSGVLDESVTVTLSAGAGYRASDVSRRVEVDDDAPTPFDGTIMVDPETITVEEGSTVNVAVTLSEAPTTDVVLKVINPSGSVFEDVTLSSSNINTSNWSNTITLSIEAAEDSDYDDEVDTIILVIEVDDSDGGVTRSREFARKSLIVSVDDDDTPPSGSIVVSSPTVSLDEGGNDGTFFVSLGGTAPTQNVVLSVTSADTGAVTVSPATLTFTPANSTTTQTVTVSPVDDDDSADESVTIALAVTSNNLTAADQITTVTVDDDEVSSVDFDREGPLTITEGNSLTIAVMLGGQAPTQNVTVNIGKSNADVKIDTDPNADGDQQALTFTPQNSTDPQSVVITVVHDADVTDETDTITFAATGGITATSTKALTIIDDDTPRIVVRPAGTLVFDEGRTHEMTVNLSGNTPTTDVTVALTNTNSDITFDTNPNIAGNQTALTFTPTNSTVPQTVSVMSIVDSDSTDDTDTITLTATGGISATMTKAVDLRERPFRLSSDDALVIPEGASRVFSFRLAARPTGDVDVAVSSTNQDITVSPESFSFSTANWNSSRNVSVSVAEDDDPDDDRGTVILTATGSGLTGRTVDKLIEVDDNDDIRFSVDTLEVDEEGESTFTVRLWKRPSGNVNLNFSNDNQDVTVDVDPNLDGVQNILSFSTLNWDQRMTVTVKAARDIDTIDDTDSIVITSQDVSGATLPVRVNDTTFTVIKSPAGGLRLEESAGQTLYFALDKPPNADQIQVRLSNENEDITLNPRVLTFTLSNWQTAQSVRIFARDDNDTDDDSDTVTIAATGIFDRRFEVSVADADQELEQISPRFILSPEERIVIVEGRASFLHVRLNGRPTSEVVVDLQRTNPVLRLSPPQISFGPSTWKDPVVVRVSADADADTTSHLDTITLVADGFPDTRLAVEVIDETGIGWPVKTRALAFPPATVHDSATMRVRCAQNTPCTVYMDCKAQDGTPFSGELPSPIPAFGTTTLTNARLAEVIGGSWAGRGRLGCDLRSISEISAQIWTRSGDGVLVNNTAFLRSAPEGDVHRADVESISSPGNSEKSNLRIRCISENGVRCHEMSLACYDDAGNRYDGALGSLLSGSVLHLQSESLADIIRYRWNDMSLACELRSNQPFTVQVLTRTGGGGALVNNSATGSP